MTFSAARIPLADEADRGAPGRGPQKPVRIFELCCKMATKAPVFITTVVWARRAKCPAYSTQSVQRTADGVARERKFVKSPASRFKRLTQ
jgi:hypothetical protein